MKMNSQKQRCTVPPHLIAALKPSVMKDVLPYDPARYFINQIKIHRFF